MNWVCSFVCYMVLSLTFVFITFMDISCIFN
uniref:Uncharacterized protein n=1 Tax=Anguilla anguilla TaxID=7936 RepID=A0A0E9QUH0_ANGAN